jgi:quercetin dioxygenase-like cupin family protein
MGITRLYTGDDGESHIAELDLAAHPELTSSQPATGIVFRSAEPGNFIDWHPAPRRQFVITLSGEAEIGLGDGTVYQFGPGHVNLAEDLTGRGHTTRVISKEPRVTATIVLAG